MKLLHSVDFVVEKSNGIQNIGLRKHILDQDIIPQPISGVFFDETIVVLQQKTQYGSQVMHDHLWVDSVDFLYDEYQTPDGGVVSLPSLSSKGYFDLLEDIFFSSRLQLSLEQAD